MRIISRRDIVKGLGALLPTNALSAAAATPASAEVAQAVAVDEQRVRDFIDTIKPAVALLEVETATGAQWGSCFFISSDGVAITNRHVVSGSQKATCIIKNKERRVTQIVKIDPQYDLAVVKVDVAKPTATVPLGDSDALHEGILLGVTGYPIPLVMVWYGIALDSSTSRGALNGLRFGSDENSYLGERALQIDAPVTHGNSGGPVFRLDTGEVIGVLTSNVGAGNLTIAVPINMAKILVSTAGGRLTPNVLSASSPEAVVEPGNLRSLNTIGVSKELPPLFGIPFAYTRRPDEEQTRAAIQDWERAVGQIPPRVTPMTLHGDQIFFGSTDGKLRRWDTTQMNEDFPVLMDVSGDGQIFVYPPVSDEETLCAVSGALDLTNELKHRQDFLGGTVSNLPVLGWFLPHGKKEYITVEGAGQVFGINRRNGSVMWTRPTGFVSTPVLYNGKVYFGGIGRRGCLNALDGRDVYKEVVRTGGDNPEWNYIGYAGPPGVYSIVIPTRAMHEPNMPLVLHSSGQARIECLDPMSDKILWRINIGNVGDRSQPMNTAMFVDEKKSVLYALALQIVTAVDLNTHKVLWSYDRGKVAEQERSSRDKTDIRTVVFTPGMVVQDGIIYVGTTDKKLLAINGADKSEIWSYPTRGEVGLPVYHEGQIFFGSTDHYLHVVDARNGQLQWKVRIDSPVRSRVLIHNGMVYAPTEDGTLYTIRIPVA